MLQGKKTLILAVMAVLIALCELFGMDVTPSLDQTTAWNALWAAGVALSIRFGLRKDVEETSGLPLR